MAEISGPDPNAARPRAPRRRPGILLVDDAAIVRSKLGDVLRQNGFFIWVAAEGTQAIEIFRQQHEHIDLVLLDLHLPAMDGVEILAALREISPDLRCIFLTGDTAADVEDLLGLGALEVLLKPIEPADIVRTLNRVLELDHPAPTA